MERGQVIVSAVVVAALALFGLKVWSDRAAESDLDLAKKVASERLARAGGVRGDSESVSGSGGADGGRLDRAGNPLRPGSGGTGVRGGVGPDGRGAADMARGGGGRVGGAVGSSGSARVAGGSGGVGIVGSESGGGLGGPKVQQKDSLVEFLGSQPPTQSDLASPKNAEGDDVALKLEKTDDIDAQGGEATNVEDADEGDGIKITDESDIQFPNNVNPDAATFSFRIQPDWSGTDQSDNALLQLRGQHEWSNRIELVKNGEFLRFIVTDNTGREADISVRITDWVAGQEHDIRASYGDQTTALYVDGRLVGQNTYKGELQFADGIPLRVGGDYPGSSYGPANSTIREFVITNSSSHDG